MQNLKEPSGFFTNNTGLAHGDLLGCIRPDSSNYYNSYLITFAS